MSYGFHSVQTQYQSTVHNYNNGVAPKLPENATENATVVHTNNSNYEVKNETTKCNQIAKTIFKFIASIPKGIKSAGKFVINKASNMTNPTTQATKTKTYNSAPASLSGHNQGTQATKTNTYNSAPASHPAQTIQANALQQRLLNETSKANNSAPPPSTPLSAEEKFRKGKNIPEGYTIPDRRLPPCGRNDGGFQRTTLAKAVFPADGKIVDLKPLKMNPGPISKGDQGARDPSIQDQSILNVGVTEEGKHVIMQRGRSACVPTCYAMLALDKKLEPNWRNTHFVCVVKTGEEEQYYEACGLKLAEERSFIDPDDTYAQNKNDPAKQKEVLNGVKEMIEKHGSIEVGIADSTSLVGAHSIIVDKIDLEKGTVEIRDPFHGRAMTVSTQTFTSWDVNKLRAFK